MPLAVSTQAKRTSAGAAEFLLSCRSEILAAAETDLATRSPRYAQVTGGLLEDRLAALYDTLVDSMAGASLVPLLDHAHEIAAERFHRGYDLSDVQRAYNSLEEAIWARLFAEDSPERYRTVLPWVSSAIGTAKDELARDYVKLAASDHAATLDVAALFRGESGR